MRAERRLCAQCGCSGNPCAGVDIAGAHISEFVRNYRIWSPQIPELFRVNLREQPASGAALKKLSAHCVMLMSLNTHVMAARTRLRRSQWSGKNLPQGRHAACSVWMRLRRRTSDRRAERRRSRWNAMPETNTRQTWFSLCQQSQLLIFRRCTRVGAILVAVTPKVGLTLLGWPLPLGDDVTLHRSLRLHACLHNLSDAGLRVCNAGNTSFCVGFLPY